MDEFDPVQYYEYRRKGIHFQEELFGKAFVYVGGRDLTAKICKNTSLSPGQKVLDIGCGTGGSAFFIARHYGCSVRGIDTSPTMIAIANEYRDDKKLVSTAVKHRVEFEVMGDPAEMKFYKNCYDVIFSRDSLKHSDDKEVLLNKMFRALRPGGKLIMTDYCLGEKDDWGEISEEFEDYADDWDYKLVTLDEQKQLLINSGFRHVEVFDRTKDYVELLEGHLESLKKRKDQILLEYREADLQSICSEWSEKLEHFIGGEQVWGYFTAKKIFC